MQFSKEDIELIQKFIEIRSKGLYVDSNLLTEVYNRCLNKNVRPTNCGQCCRQRLNELETALKKVKEKSEAENKTEEVKEETKDGDNTEPPKTTRGKKGKKQNGV